MQWQTVCKNCLLWISFFFFLIEKILSYSSMVWVGLLLKMVLKYVSIYIYYIYKHLSIYLKDNLLCLLYNHFKHHFKKTLKNPIIMHKVQTLKHHPYLSHYPTQENTPHGSIALTPSDQNKSNGSHQLLLFHPDWDISRSLKYSASKEMNQPFFLYLPQSLSSVEWGSNPYPPSHHLM